MGELVEGAVSTEIIEWIESVCLVPEGRDVGKPLILRDWQRAEIQKIYDNEHITRRAILTFGRKNAKTTLAALLLLVHLCGPEIIVRRNSQLFSSAMSRDQAAVLFSLAAAIVRQSEELSNLVMIRDTAKQLYCEYYGTLYRALSADATTAYGLSPVFIVHDELGQVRGPRHGLYEALETATGAQEHPLSIVISTQAPTDADLLSVLIDDAIEGHDPRVVLSLHTAPIDDDPFDEETIKKANPAYGDFLNEVEVMDMARAASRMPAREAEFRNLILNQRVEASSPFVTKSVWDANGETPDHDGRVFYGGLDLSETNDLTAFILVSQNRGGSMSVHSRFWLPEEGLEERSRKDRVPYDVWAEKGFLHTTPGRSIEYEFVAKYIANAFDERDIGKIAFDRWNMRHLRPWLVQAGMSEGFIEDKFHDFGQGFQSMSPALRNLESLLLNAKLRHGLHPVLGMCAANAVVKTDEAGGRKLDKKRSRGRIDGMVALCMACAVASEESHQKHVFPVALDSIVEDLNGPSAQ